MTETNIQDIHNRFEPKHLEEKEEIKPVQVESSTVNQIQEEKVDLNDPKRRHEYTFFFDWTDPRGKKWSGNFTNKILTVGEQFQAGLFEARKLASIDPKLIRPIIEEINFILSHLHFSLIQKPNWAENLEDIYDVELLQAIYQEVASHEAIFRGWESSKTNS